MFHCAQNATRCLLDPAINQQHLLYSFTRHILELLECQNSDHNGAGVGKSYNFFHNFPEMCSLTVLTSPTPSSPAKLMPCFKSLQDVIEYKPRLWGFDCVSLRLRFVVIDLNLRYRQVDSMLVAQNMFLDFNGDSRFSQMREKKTAIVDDCDRVSWMREISCMPQGSHSTVDDASFD